MKNNNYKGAGKAKFRESQCDRSPLCPVAKACPTGAVQKIKQGFLSIRVHYDPAGCIGCGRCVQACPHGAFSVK